MSNKELKFRSKQNLKKLNGRGTSESKITHQKRIDNIFIFELGVRVASPEVEKLRKQ